jgi:hypothetical protein
LACPQLRDGTTHYEDRATIAAPVESVFAFLDGPERLAAHMSEPSWKMAGGRMTVDVDAGGGRAVGSHIRLRGSAFGIPLSLDEVVTGRDPPRSKEWETVGEPRLLVIGAYRMGFEVRPSGGGSDLRIFIDYEPPSRNAWLGRLLGATYASWCVRMMLGDARRNLMARPPAANS